MRLPQSSYFCDFCIIVLRGQSWAASDNLDEFVLFYVQEGRRDSATCNRCSFRNGLQTKYT